MLPFSVDIKFTLFTKVKNIELIMFSSPKFDQLTRAFTGISYFYKQKKYILSKLI